MVFVMRLQEVLAALDMRGLILVWLWERVGDTLLHKYVPVWGRILTDLSDCLTLDIVRPSGARPDHKLPVFLWIYGGGFDAGGSADPRYNTSYLVNASVAIQKPIIAVSINYRVGGWGFLASKEVSATGVSNIGLYDQRLALKWIQENIHAFGGDPEKVTISGESAGGFSVGYHLTGFDGDNEGLFRAVILESGNALGPGSNI
jgi:cholinesterase